MIITRRKMLVAVFELKSIGSSFGNNMNNHSEERIGAAHDFWTAYHVDAFGERAPRPFLGWLMIMRECAASTTPVKASEKHSPVYNDFKDASYAQRCDILCLKIVQENLYIATTLMLTTDEEGKAHGHFRHLSEAGSFKRFIATFAGHMSGLAAETESD